MTFRERFLRLLEQTGTSSYRLSKDLGIPQTTIRNWRHGISEPRYETLAKLAEYFCVDVAWLKLGKTDITLPPGAKPAKPIPVLAEIPAGTPKEVLPEQRPIDYIYLSDMPQNCFAIVVRGDSMAPGIKEGEIAVFQPEVDIKNGDVVVVANEWGEAMLKRYRTRKGESLLVSDNPEYPPVKPNDHFRLIGKVIEIINRRRKF